MDIQFNRDYLCAFATLTNKSEKTLEYEETGTKSYNVERAHSYSVIRDYFSEGIKPPYHLEFEINYDINTPCATGNITTANVADMSFNESYANQIISLFAGYKGQKLGLLAHHQVVFRQTINQGADTLTHFQIQILPAIDRKQNIDFNLPVESNILKSIQKFCQRFEIEVGHSVNQLFNTATEQTKKEYCNSGTFVQIMDDLCEKIRAKWLFAPADDGNNPSRLVEVFSVDENGYCFPHSTQGINQIRISQATGLTKFPTPDVKIIYDGNSPVVEYSGEMLLNPNVKVGTRLIINDAEGKKPMVDMYVSKVCHKGSLYGDFWHTSFSGRSAGMN